MPGLRPGGARAARDRGTAGPRRRRGPPGRAAQPRHGRAARRAAAAARGGEGHPAAAVPAQPVAWPARPGGGSVSGSRGGRHRRGRGRPPPGRPGPRGHCEGAAAGRRGERGGRRTRRRLPHRRAHRRRNGDRGVLRTARQGCRDLPRPAGTAGLRGLPALVQPRRHDGVRGPAGERPPHRLDPARRPDRGRRRRGCDRGTARRLRGTHQRPPGPAAPVTRALRARPGRPTPSRPRPTGQLPPRDPLPRAPRRTRIPLRVLGDQSARPVVTNHVREGFAPGGAEPTPRWRRSGTWTGDV
ncbi:hypothetical protein SBRY_50296 [Actinacidiphila bryophytorum]|uniref:Uncharacterized protein n=1 Tax=Actinacidiphila bryophytorum TaxID=1436133 RepID=A0A9W4H4P4_9ACTN|nr:hypothetical protein SBRY_50296 [Actinacidiphila bryophytorum]